MSPLIYLSLVVAALGSGKTDLLRAGDVESVG